VAVFALQTDYMYSTSICIIQKLIAA
jgi:hypothetical protein